MHTEDHEWACGWADCCHGVCLMPNVTDAYRAGWLAAEAHGL